MDWSIVKPARTYDERVEQRMDELRSVFLPPYSDLSNWTFEDHGPGECIQCDAYKRLAAEEDDDA